MTEPARIVVRPVVAGDRPWVEAYLAAVGADIVARRGEVVRPVDHPMLIATVDDEPAGLLTYVAAGEGCEILTLHAIRQWRGTGTALVTAVRTEARKAGYRTVSVVTTNDNVDALRFYQRRGFRIRAVRPGAVDDARRSLKPGIPVIGDHGIPLRDEIELEADV